MSTPIFVDTLRAAKFLTGWTKRQAELGMAKENVKIMTEIGLKLRENKQSVSECVESLKKLAQMFEIDHRNNDNVPDFYDMGRYIVCYIVTLWHCYIVTLLYCYATTLLHLYCYTSTFLHWTFFYTIILPLFISSIYLLIF